MTAEEEGRDFPGGPVVKNLPSNAGDTGLIPGQGTKIHKLHSAAKKEKREAFWGKL